MIFSTLNLFIQLIIFLVLSMLFFIYLSGLVFDSETDFNPAKCITASNLYFLKIFDKKNASVRSASSKLNKFL